MIFLYIYIKTCKYINVMAVFNDIEDFWEWKRNITKREFFCQGKFKKYEDFIDVWNNIKDKKDEIPPKGTGILTDYYSWKSQGKPKEKFAGPSEPYFEKYYKEKIVKEKVIKEKIVEEKL